MIFMPYPLSTLHLDKEELEIDKKHARRLVLAVLEKKHCI